VIPDLEASDVELKGPPAKFQRGRFHQQLVVREERAAGVACSAVAWTENFCIRSVLRGSELKVRGEDTSRFGLAKAHVRPY
jgi:hypothetical protein